MLFPQSTSATTRSPDSDMAGPTAATAVALTALVAWSQNHVLLAFVGRLQACFSVASTLLLGGFCQHIQDVSK